MTKASSKVRAGRVATGALCLAACLTAGRPLPALSADAHAGSEAEQRACTPDVFRLCMNAIPDDDAIVACLQSKKPLLSPACAEVFSDKGVTHARNRRQDR